MGKEIVVKYLKPGELAKCKECGTEVVIPEDAKFCPDSEADIYIQDESGHTDVQEAFWQESNDATEMPEKWRRYKLVYWLTQVFTVIGWIIIIIGAILLIIGFTDNVDWLRMLIGFGAAVYGLLVVYFTQLILIFVDIENNTRGIYKTLTQAGKEKTKEK